MHPLAVGSQQLRLYGLSHPLLLQLYAELGYDPWPLPNHLLCACWACWARHRFVPRLSCVARPLDLGQHQLQLGQQLCVLHQDDQGGNSNHSSSSSLRWVDATLTSCHTDAAGVFWAQAPTTGASTCETSRGFCKQLHGLVKVWVGLALLSKKHTMLPPLVTPCVHLWAHRASVHML